MSSASPVDVALALVWRAGCILITRRRQDTHLGGLWEFPGGKCRSGEQPEDCAVREALEEVGVGCRSIRVLPPIVHTYPERTVRLYPVECEYLGGAPRAIEVEEWRWVQPAELVNFPFPDANAELIHQLQSEAEHTDRS